ncbi:hypothetical protein AZI87_04280 [Bdellovibrio bacteriovorus]|uniref:Uncharacterized protein n=1 Tax=Bdellovibrio bacteriovorus TaxID=959 RepID=A0A162GM03_BDEBC|nr:hypothetical protein [Bdellovibrio bacteriovorus]KYG68472.1 hypothetical protein AZI87_04280 [Bdellovibrio bacteriovorus]
MIDRKYIPYILGVFLLVALLAMAQTPRVLLKSRTSERQVQVQESKSNYFYLPVGSKNVSNLTEVDYATLIGQFLVKNFAKVQTATGKNLVIPYEWQSPYFAAFAQQKEDSMQISLWGGMARAPGATKAALAAILCHELGHIIGGEPRQTIPGSDWASTEGQSDFYAASNCLPELLTAYPELVPVIEDDVRKACDQNTLCERSMQAGLEMIRFVQQYSYRDYVPVNINTPAAATNELVRNTYPSDQCRLDSFVQGSLCQLGTCRAPVCWLP